MVIPVLVLAFLSVVGGLLVLPFRGIEVIAHFLEPAFEEVAPIDPSSFLAGAALSLLAVAIALTGIAIGVAMIFAYVWGANVGGLFTALGICMALACSGASTSGRTEMHQLGLALISEDSSVQSSPSSSP